MTNEEISKFGEIQYLKGRLDELHKAFPTVLDLTRQRKLDVRIDKYFTKLKAVDEIAYRTYLIELETRKKSKERSKKNMKKLLNDILVDIKDEELKNRIIKQIEKY